MITHKAAKLLYYYFHFSDRKTKRGSQRWSNLPHGTQRRVVGLGIQTQGVFSPLGCRTKQEGLATGEYSDLLGTSFRFVSHDHHVGLTQRQPNARGTHHGATFSRTTERALTGSTPLLLPGTSCAWCGMSSFPSPLFLTRVSAVALARLCREESKCQQREAARLRSLDTPRSGGS